MPSAPEEGRQGGNYPADPRFQELGCNKAGGNLWPCDSSHALAPKVRERGGSIKPRLIHSGGAWGGEVRFHRMKPTEIRDLIVHLLAGATGKPEKHWQEVVGEIEALPLAFIVKGNWRVSQKGSAEDIRAAGAAVEFVRKEHPYVAE